MRLEDPRQETAARALARGENQSGAARAAGVDRATVSRWMHYPAFATRIDQLEVVAQRDNEEDPAGDAERGLARLVPIAEAVIEAALRAEPFNGKIPSPQQHSNALKTIELARKLEPKASFGETKGPSLADLIQGADAARSSS